IVFHKLPPDQQDHWRQVSKDEVAAEQAAATLTDPAARDRYVSSLLRTLDDLVREVGRKANVRLAVQVMTEHGEGRFKLKSLVSDNLSNLARSDALSGMLDALKEEAEASAELTPATGGIKVEGGPPARDLIIDFAHGGRPVFPEVGGMGVLALRQEKLAFKFSTQF
ncbi:hypothetical protein FRC09_005969, partial [Ceratobasidium sp. 395]